MAIVLAFLISAAHAEPKQLDGGQIDRITGAKGTLNKEENVYKVSFPRDDVKVTVDGVRMPPFMGPARASAIQTWTLYAPRAMVGCFPARRAGPARLSAQRGGHRSHTR